MAMTSQHEDLMKMADLIKPATVRAAATLRLVDHIDEGATTAEQLAERTETQVDVLDSLLRNLTRMELLSRDADGHYAVAEAGAPLRSSDPMGLRRQLSMDGLMGYGDLAIVNLLHTVRTGEPAHRALFGGGYWESVNENPAFVEAWETEIPERLSLDADLIYDAYDWSQVGSVVDLGGNNGALIIELAQRNPHLKGTVLDLRNAAELAGRRIEQEGLADRCTAVAGSFFDPLPDGADVYLLSAVLGDWNDEDATAILRRCAEAAGPEGRVLVADVRLDEMQSTEDRAAVELYMRALMPKPSRTVEDVKALGPKAGLEVSWEGPSTNFRSLVEFRRA